jgi:hypothetical protein
MPWLRSIPSFNTRGWWLDDQHLTLNQDLFASRTCRYA